MTTLCHQTYSNTKMSTTHTPTTTNNGKTPTIKASNNTISTNKNILLYLIVGAIIFILNSYNIQAESYTILGNDVYINDSRAQIVVSPHTVTSDNPCMVVTAQSKLFSGNIDFALGVDTDDMRPTEIYSNVPNNITTNYSYSCDQANTFFNYTLSPKVGYCYLNGSVNGTNNTLLYSHSFTSANSSTKTMYWSETFPSDWTLMDWQPDTVGYTFDGKNKWHTATQIYLERYQDYKYKICFDIPATKIGDTPKTYKYDLAFKRSTDTIQTAIANNRFYFIDPWTQGTTGVLFNFHMDNSSNQSQLWDDNYNTNFQIIGTYPTILNNGAKNQSRVFSGSTGYLSIPSANFSGTSQLSFIFWMNWTGADNSYIFRNTGTEYMEIFLLSNRLYIENNKNVNRFYVNDIRFWTINNSYNQVVWVFNGSATGNYNRSSVYINGVHVPQANCTYEGTIGTTTAPLGDPFMFGGSSYSQHFYGGLDELTIINRSINTDEASAVWNEGIGLFYPFSTNNAPSVTIPLLLDNVVYANTSIVVNTTVTDADGNTSTLYWVVYKNNVLIFTASDTGVSNGTTFNHTFAANWSHFDNITISVFAGDGIDNSSAQNSSTKTVSNWLPTTSNITLTPLSLDTATSLTANVTYYDLVDADNGTVYFKLYINGSYVRNFSNSDVTNTSTTAYTFDPTNYSANDNISIGVLAYDGFNYSTEVFSSNITVSPIVVPIMQSASIVPGIAYYNDTLGFECRATDAGGENLTYSYLIYKNGILYLNGTTILNYTQNVTVNVTTQSASNHFTNWTLSCMASNPSQNSSWLNSSVLTISNTAPVLSNLVTNNYTISSSTNVYANVTYTDADGDAGNVTFSWYRNGTFLLNTTNNSIASGAVAQSALAYGNYSQGDNITVNVIAFDSNYSNQLNSTQTHINKYPLSYISYYSNTGSLPPIYTNSTPVIRFNYSDEEINYYALTIFAYNLNVSLNGSNYDTYSSVDNYPSSTEFNLRGQYPSLFVHFNIIGLSTQYADNIGWGDYGPILNITILNSLPVAGTPTLSPIPVYKNSSAITCINGSYTDADSDPAGAWEYTFYVNGTAIQTSGSNQFTSANWDHEDIIICGIRAYDGYNYSTQVNSTPLTISNTPPQITAQYWNTTTIEAIDVAAAYCNVTDADSDTINTTYRIYYPYTTLFYNNSISSGNSSLNVYNLTPTQDITTTIILQCTACDYQNCTNYTSINTSLTQTALPALLLTNNISLTYTGLVDATANTTCNATTYRNQAVTTTYIYNNTIDNTYTTSLLSNYTFLSTDYRDSMDIYCVYNTSWQSTNGIHTTILDDIIDSNLTIYINSSTSATDFTTNLSGTLYYTNPINTLYSLLSLTYPENGTYLAVNITHDNNTYLPINQLTLFNVTNHYVEYQALPSNITIYFDGTTDWSISNDEYSNTSNGTSFYITSANLPSGKNVLTFNWLNKTTPAQSYEFYNNALFTPVNLSLITSADQIIWIKVIDSSGNPIDNASVYIYRQNFTWYDISYSALIGRKFTTSHPGYMGETFFSIQNNSNYFITVAANGYTTAYMRYIKSEELYTNTPSTPYTIALKPTTTNSYDGQLTIAVQSEFTNRSAPIEFCSSDYTNGVVYYGTTYAETTWGSSIRTKLTLNNNSLPCVYLRPGYHWLTTGTSNITLQIYYPNIGTLYKNVTISYITNTTNRMIEPPPVNANNKFLILLLFIGLITVSTTVGMIATNNTTGATVFKIGCIGLTFFNLTFMWLAAPIILHYLMLSLKNVTTE